MTIRVTRIAIICPAKLVPMSSTLSSYDDTNEVLQSLGNGRYQRKWFVRPVPPASCVRFNVDLGDGVAHEARSVID